MSISRLAVLALVPACLSIAGCPNTGSDAALQTQSGCTSTDSRIGQTASLRTRAHGVSGTARIVDDCTIVIDNFNYDGGGLDVRIYGAKSTSTSAIAAGVILTGDLVGQSFSGQTLTIPLPVGVSLDDVPAISVWCIDAAVSFGDGTFSATN